MSESTFTLTDKGQTRFYKIEFGEGNEIASIFVFSEEADWVPLPEKKHDFVLASLKKKAKQRSKPKPVPKKETIMRAIKALDQWAEKEHGKKEKGPTGKAPLSKSDIQRIKDRMKNRK